MTGAVLPCTFCYSLRREDVKGMNFCRNCDLLNGGSCTACQDYVALEAKISATTQLLDDLLSQRLKIHTRVNQTHDLLTRSFPLEIIRSVFRFCVPARWDFDDLNETELGDPEFTSDSDLKCRGREMISNPLKLGRICRSWRNVAWAIQPLWTELLLDFSRLENTDSVTFTKEWLDRTGQLPLSIRITNTQLDLDEIANDQGRVASQLVALVNQRSKQWENLDISGYSWWIDELEPGLKGAPNLQALRLKFYDSDNEFGYKHSVTKLRPSQLFLNECELNLIHIEWSLLTRVCLSYTTLDDSIEIFRLTSNLAYCKFYLVSGVGHPLPDRPIVYQALEILEFDCPNDLHDDSQALEILQFLKSFIFPNMKHLKLKSGGSSSDRFNQFSWDPVASHIISSSPPLISLAIQHPGPHSIIDSIIPALRKTPLLRDLELSTSSEESLLIKTLAETSIISDHSTQTDFLPNLQSIKFILDAERCCGGGEFWDALPQICGPISAIRDPSRRPLRALRVRAEYITMDSDPIVIDSTEVVLQLSKLQREGIILDLHTRIDKAGDFLETSQDYHDL